MARALRRIQPRLRSRHAVRAQDRRQYRRVPDEPAPARDMGLTLVPDDQLATIVNPLEMAARPALRPIPESPSHLVRWERPEPRSEEHTSELQTIMRISYAVSC